MKYTLRGSLSLIAVIAITAMVLISCGKSNTMSADNDTGNTDTAVNLTGAGEYTSITENFSSVSEQIADETIAHGEPQQVKIKDSASVSYLGPAGTYTEEAARLFFGEETELFPQTIVDNAIDELNAGNVDYAVIPQENTIGGAVTNYIDALIKQQDVYVIGEVVIPISQTLMGLPGTELSDIRTVCSHAQGITQSAEWRSQNLPDAVTEEKDSTAAAASYVAETGDKTIAAIAAPGAAELYGLEVLAENVQITMENKTRFYVLAKEPSDSLHTNTVFVATCSADLIDDIIIDIHKAGFEMTAIHDRPEGSYLGSYHYIIEAENENGITGAQIETVTMHPEIRWLGCFQVTQK